MNHLSLFLRSACWSLLLSCLPMLGLAQVNYVSFHPLIGYELDQREIRRYHLRRYFRFPKQAEIRFIQAEDGLVALWESAGEQGKLTMPQSVLESVLYLNIEKRERELWRIWQELSQFSPADSTPNLRILRSSKEYVLGLFRGIHDDSLLIEGPKGSYAIPLEEVRGVEFLLDPESKAGTFAFPMASAERAFFTPTAFPVQKGQLSWQNRMAAANGLQWGINKYVSVYGQSEVFSLLPRAFNRNQTIGLMLGGKASIPVNKHLHFALGGTLGGRFFPNTMRAGIAFGMVSLGRPDQQISVGVFAGKSEFRRGEHLYGFMANASYRLSDHWKISAEIMGSTRSETVEFVYDAYGYGYRYWINLPASTAGVHYLWPNCEFGLGVLGATEVYRLEEFLDDSEVQQGQRRYWVLPALSFAVRLN